MLRGFTYSWNGQEEWFDLVYLQPDTHDRSDITGTHLTSNLARRNNAGFDGKFSQFLNDQQM